MPAGLPPGLRRAPRELAISDEAMAPGLEVENLEQLRAVLQDLQSLPPERPELRARPLAVLAVQIGALHEPNERMPAFKAILASIMQTPAGQRHPMDAPLMMLAAQVAVLHQAEQQDALQRLLQAQEPPGSLAEGLHLLAGRLEDLPQAARPQACAQVLQWAARLEPAPARELAVQLSELPEAAQAPALSGLLQPCSSNAPGQRTEERLAVLARGSMWLSGPVHVQAVRGVLAAAESLAPEQREAVLQPLCKEVCRLPAAEQAATWQAVVRSYLAVPPGQLAAALAQLHDGIRTLRHAGDGQQPAVPLMPAVLDELPAWRQLGTLPPEERDRALQLCTRILDEMPQADSQGVLEQVPHAIPQPQQVHRDPSGSRQVRLCTEPADRLSGLPQALHEKITVGMAPKDRFMLACSNRALHDSLQGFSISDRVVAQGRGVEGMEQLRAALQDVQSLPLGQTDLRARPLAVLAGRVRHQPRVEDVPGAFDAVLATILQTPAGERRSMDVPLMMLAAQVTFLDWAEKEASALQRLLQAQEPAGSLDAGLHLLADRVEDLPQAVRPQAATQVLAWARGLEPGPALELAHTLPYLPNAALQPVLSGLLQACSSVAPGPRTETLKALASIGSPLQSEPLHLQAVQGVLAAAEPLAPEQRWAVLKPLCRDLYLLPQAEHASTWQAVVHSYLAVPPGQLDAAIVQLNDQVKTLGNVPARQRLAVPLGPTVQGEFLAWLQRGEALAEAPGEAIPPQARSVVPRQEVRSPLLEALAKAIPALPEADRGPYWQITLQAVEQWAPGAEARQFRPVAALIGVLPVADRPAAFTSLQQALDRRPARNPLQSAVVLGTACFAQPRAKWPDFIGRVAHELLRIPDLEQRAISLTKLAARCCLAGPAAAGPKVPGRMGEPLLDVRMQCLGRVLREMPDCLWPPSEELLRSLNDLITQVKQRSGSGEDATFLQAVLAHLQPLKDRWEMVRRLFRQPEQSTPPGAAGRRPA